MRIEGVREQRFIGLTLPGKGPHLTISQGDTIGDQVSFLQSRMGHSFEPGSPTWTDGFTPAH